MEQVDAPLLKIVLDGQVVAEAVLRVYDCEKAWFAFCQGFQGLSAELVGEVFNTVHVATHESMRQTVGDQGIVIDLWTKPKPQIFVPEMAGNDYRG